MNPHFAHARVGAHPALSLALRTPAVAAASNDNGVEPLSDTLLRASLTHFARYGLGAANQARREAEQAHALNDTDGYRWWLAVCAALDRRMARSMRHALESTGAQLT